MYSHMMVGTNDIEKSATFYNALFKSVGGKDGFKDAKGRYIWLHKDSVFLATAPIDGQPATVSNGATIGFAMDSTEQVDTWHAAGISAGGTTIEDPPGWRENDIGKMYLAYLRDPDGNKLCAMSRG